jgi:hypothetical protein
VCGAWTREATLYQIHRPLKRSTTANLNTFRCNWRVTCRERGICGDSCGNPVPALKLAEEDVRGYFFLALQTLAENTEDWLQLLLLLLIHKGI